MVVFKKKGIEPGKYSSKIDVVLSPDEHCSNSMKRILEQTLAVVRQNINGIKNDTDTEFLHDFRVAIRRVRSAVTQIPDVFPNELCSGFEKDLKYFGQSSNRLRDIDVYLLNRDCYLEILPEELRPGIKPFFNSLQKKRKLELQNFINNLNSRRYHRLITKWESLLKAESDMNIPLSNAARPVIDVAKQYILQRYNKIIKAANNIDEAKSDEALHNLRIQCKKLRYLLEFFISLFPKKDINLFIKQLKKMQDNLGEFNDLLVQQHELKKHLSQIDLKSKKRIKEAAAVGGLISVFKYKQTGIRTGFKSIFEEFTNKKNTELFNKLFN